MDYAAKQVAPDVVSAEYVAPRGDVDFGVHVRLFGESLLYEFLVVVAVRRYGYAKLRRRFLHALADRHRHGVGYLNFQARVRFKGTLDDFAAV